MFAVLVLDHRLAFLFLAVLNLGAAVPLALGWARVLPEEPLPFGNADDSFGRIRNIPSPDELRSKRRDPFAIVLLLCVTPIAWSTFGLQAIVIDRGSSSERGRW